jgi:hypothetical protein
MSKEDIRKVILDSDLAFESWKNLEGATFEKMVDKLANDINKELI